MASSNFLATEHLLTNPAGREYRLRLWRPASLKGGTTVPTLLLLDGQYLDDTLASALQDLGPAQIQIASLGYLVSDRKAIAPWRAYDYTPAAPGPDQCDPRSAAWPCGGATELLHFLAEQVLPLLKQDIPAGPMSLFGHSYGGLFSLYCRLEAPSLFDRIYAASPSLWWYWPHMVDLLQSRAQRVASGTLPPLQMMVG